MEPLSTGVKLFAFQKAAFNSTMDAFETLLDQNSKMAEPWDNKKEGGPKQVVAAEVWNEFIKQNLQSYRKTVNDAFDNLESFFPFSFDAKSDGTEV